jgi:hypothetical protein
MITKPVLQKISKGILHTEDEDTYSYKKIGRIKYHQMIT